MRMITVVVSNLSKEKIKKVEKAIFKYGGRLIYQGKKDEVSFDCPDLETKRLICKEISKIKEE